MVKSSKIPAWLAELSAIQDRVGEILPLRKAYNKDRWIGGREGNELERKAYCLFVWESEFGGLDWSTGLEQWTTGMEYWNGIPEYLLHLTQFTAAPMQLLSYLGRQRKQPAISQALKRALRAFQAL